MVGHLRYLIEKIGPEMRQYVVADNDEELPFSRDQRRFIYASAKRENAYFGFGTDNDLNQPGYVLFRHSAFPHESPPEEQADHLPMRKVLGEAHGREHAFQPESSFSVLVGWDCRPRQWWPWPWVPMASVSPARQ